MTTSNTRSRRLVFSLALGGLLLLPLASCSGNEENTGSSALSAASSAASSAAGPAASSAASSASSAASSAASDAASAASDASSAASSAGQEAASKVDCSGTSCTVTLSGNGAQVDVLGTSVSLGGVQDGRANLQVAGKSASCASGDKVSAAPLTLTCTTVTEEKVVLAASLG